MNTKIKVAVGTIAGLIAGTMLVGTAVAAPRMMATPAPNGYTMMNTNRTSDTLDRPSIAEMNAFLDRYRTSDGSLDIDRMHADVTSGKVTPPCAGGTTSTGQTTEAQGGRLPYRRGPAMMQGLSGSSSTGYGMMGSIY
jgi:hypothetical protein